ncbi:MAG: hypothetical protein P8Y63_12640 [Deltaproteobacteria bacterium]
MKRFTIGLPSVLHSFSTDSSAHKIMTDEQIEKLYVLMTQTTPLGREYIRSLYLDSIKENNIPLSVKYYKSSKDASIRSDMVKFVIRYSRKSELACSLGIKALRDRSKNVRRNGCAVLAYSLRQDMIPYLAEILDNNDVYTREKAKSAIVAIAQGNIDMFVNPGNAKWSVTLDRDDIPTNEEIDFCIQKKMPSLVKPIENILGTIYPSMLLR